MTIEDLKTDLQSIANVLEVGTYGSEWLYMIVSKNTDDSIKRAARNYRYWCERFAYILLNGGTIEFHDGYEEDDNEDGRPCSINVTLDKWQKGIDKLKELESSENCSSLQHILDEREDYCDCNVALQVVMYNEIMY